MPPFDVFAVSTSVNQASLDHPLTTTTTPVRRIQGTVLALDLNLVFYAVVRPFVWMACVLHSQRPVGLITQHPHAHYEAQTSNAAVTDMIRKSRS